MKITENKQILKLWHFALKHNVLFFNLPIVAYMAAIFYFSSMSNPPVPGIAIQLFSSNTSTVLHFIEYSILSFMLGIALRHSKNAFFSRNAYLLAIVIAGLYGISDELHQLFVPGRYCTLSDALTDFVGASAAQFVRWIFKKEKSILNKVL
jgi:hypothetical protein